MDKKEIILIIPLLLRGKASKEQESMLVSWVRECEENRAIYREFCVTYYKLHYARQWSEVDVEKAISLARGKRKKRMVFLQRRLWLSGVAALVMVSLSIAFLNQKKESVPVAQQQVSGQIRSGERKAMLTLADGRQVELTADYKVELDLGGVRATEDSVAGLVYQLKDSAATTPEYHTLTIPRGGEYIMVLSDGTKVWLNSESEIRYPVVFGKGKREVFIIGEAFFEVVKDARHPFVVHTSCTQTTVLGTSFNVMAYRNEAQTEITLLKGAVEVQVGQQEQRIRPGQQIQVDNASKEMKCREVNASQYASWKEGIFDFEGMKLEELAAKLSRWYDVDFFFASQSAGGKRFTGAIKRNNSLQFMLDFIERASNVHFEVRGNVIRVYNR